MTAPISADPWAGLYENEHDLAEVRSDIEAELDLLLRTSSRVLVVDPEGKEWRNAEHIVEGWVRLGENYRLVRASSKQLAVNGPYTVAYQQVRA